MLVPSSRIPAASGGPDVHWYLWSMYILSLIAVVASVWCVGHRGAASTTESSSSGKQCQVRNVHPNSKHPGPYRYAFRSMHVFV